MAEIAKQTEEYANTKCSFCGKPYGKAELLIVNDDKSAYICDECVDLCFDIMEDEKYND